MDHDLIRNRNRYFQLAFLVAILLGSLPAMGQQISVSTPFHSLGDSYYENMGVNFGFALPGGRGPGSRVVGYAGNGVITPNLRFNQGSAASTIPQFGGYDPNASARFGFSNLRPGGGGFSLGFDFGKGSTRSRVTTTPSVTVPNGYGGSITNGGLVPFVTGITPIVGGGGYGPRPIDNAVTRAMNSGLDLTKPRYSEDDAYRPSSRELPSVGTSTAQTGALSVAAIKAKRAAKKQAEQNAVADLVRQARVFEDEGDYTKAGVYYRKAVTATTDKETKQAIRRRLNYVRELKSGKRAKAKDRNPGDQ